MIRQRAPANIFISGESCRIDGLATSWPSALASRLPRSSGTCLLTVSADLTIDEEATGLGYYSARRTIPEAELANLNGKNLLPGSLVLSRQTRAAKSPMR